MWMHKLACLRVRDEGSSTLGCLGAPPREQCSVLQPSKHTNLHDAMCGISCVHSTPSNGMFKTTFGNCNDLARKTSVLRGLERILPGKNTRKPTRPTLPRHGAEACTRKLSPIARCGFNSGLSREVDS